MSRTGIATLALIAGLLTASGCGGSNDPSSSNATSAENHPVATSTTAAAQSGPLTRAELLAKGDAICYRLNAERRSTTIGSHAAYARLVPPLAASELAGAVEMSKLVPPPSMKYAWGQIVNGSRTLAEATGHFHTWAEASNLKLSRPVDVILTKAINEVERAARKAGFKDCAQFA